MHAPIGIIQLRNNKLKSVLLHILIEPESLKKKEKFEYQTVKFIQNLIHRKFCRPWLLHLPHTQIWHKMIYITAPSSPFTVVLFESFIKQFALETSFLSKCTDSNCLFDFLAKIDEAISQIHTNVGQLFYILNDHKATAYIEK